jgi:hypothetical protein
LAFRTVEAWLIIGLETVNPLGGIEPLGGKYVPLSFFKDEDHRKRFQDEVSSMFWGNILGLLWDEAFLHMSDSVEMAAASQALELWSASGKDAATRELVTGHAALTAARLRKMFGVVDHRGRHSKWTKSELRRLVRGIVSNLPLGSRTYATVAEELKKIAPERAPKSGNALRMLCNRLGVEVPALKKQGGKRTVKP